MNNDSIDNDSIDNDSIERIIQKELEEALAHTPRDRVVSGLAFDEESQRALDAWIAAGAIPGDEHLYGLSVGNKETKDK
jgi:hypothetical protein